VILETKFNRERCRKARKTRKVQEKHPKAQEIKIPRLSKPYRKSQKKNSDPESPDTSVGKTKDDDESDSDPNFRTNAGLKAQLFPKEGDGYVDPTFHGPDFGLPVHATKSDLDELLQRGREYDSLQMQLCILCPDPEWKYYGGG
jgi:hypothetical protein